MARDSASICQNGHVINSNMLSAPEYNTAFCKQCGTNAVTACNNCGDDIPGSNREVFVPYRRPSFCAGCGHAYPWTVASLAAAKALALELNTLDDQERRILAESLDDLITDTPRTPLAATRFKKLVAKAGKTAADGLHDIVIDILSETAKRMIWPNS